MFSLTSLSCHMLGYPLIFRGPWTTRTSLTPLLPAVSPQSWSLLCGFLETLRIGSPCCVSAALEDPGHFSTGFCIADGVPTSSHSPFPCSSYLQIPVDHPHLVAVQDGL